ncbi:hypothetical protein ACFOOM_13635 [Streptomyces echinoruber]|uniref:HAAS signaling domain-containing protein n=1 Tax=Streptomyces echinoruber TaxID=68898 RepID=UPI00167DECE0|nr:hypothetical protein [Streptomyces echinoruber]
MGIESDQVVYEYLSRVGDVAQQRQLPSAARMRLVAELRDEIDRRRARTPVDSPAAVRRIIARLGSPDEVVAAAGGTGGADAGPQSAGAVPASVPAQPTPAAPHPESGGERPKGLRRMVPRARSAERPQPQPPSAPRADAPTPPHLAGERELGSGGGTDWWRVAPGPPGAVDEVPGFVGGVEVPELLKPPPPRELTPEKADGKDEGEKEAGVAPVAEAVVDAPASRRRLPLPRAGTWSNPLLLLAAALLVAGAVLGSWVPLLLGWLIAWASRRLTETETKWAVLGMPGLALAAGVVWLWGRTDGRWGTPVAEGHLNDAVAQTWPWVVRGAAVLSALFLVWRSQRVRG